jgi:peptide/nickel transport system substrate-binding protein
MKNPAFRKLSFVLVIICIFVSLLILGCSTSATTPITSAVTPTASTTSKPQQTASSPPTSSVQPVVTGTTTTSPVPALTATQTPAVKPGQPQYGGTLSILGLGLPAENLGYIAIAVPRWNPTLPSPCVERLVSWNNQGLFAPGLATAWKWSDDHLSLTLTIRKGIKFHDGSDFNAQAVKYLLDLVKDSNRSELKSVKDIEVIDDVTVKINLKVFDALLLTDLATTAGAIVSPTALQKYGVDYNVTHPVGTGPFKFVSWSRDVNLKYEKFNGYWQSGKPYLDNLQYILLADQLTARTAFISGAGQISGTLNPLDAADLVKRGNFNVTSNVGPLIAFAPDGSHKDSPFYNLKVRQAVAYAVDTKTIVNTIGYGYLIQTNQPSAPGLWNYNPEVVGYPFNPQKAKDLLKEAGFASGFKTTIYYEVGYDDMRNFCLAAQQQLNNVGINAALEATTMAKMTDLMTKGWQNGLVVTRATMGTNYSPLNTIRRNFSSLGTNTVSINHVDAIESLLQQALSEIDENKLVKEMQQINKMMIDDYCTIIPFYSRVSMWATTPEIKNAGWLTGEDFTVTSADTWLSK